MSIYNNCHYWNGTVYGEWWTTNGFIYREDDEGNVLPSYIYYDDDGNVERVIYHNKLGIIHRSDGPAEINLDYEGYIIDEIFYINGEEMSYRRYESIIDLLNNACKHFKKRKRQKIFYILRSKMLNKLHDDICKLVVDYIY